MATVTPTGGRPDAGPQAGSIWSGGVARVAVLLVVSLAVHGWLLARTSTTARDSIGFAQLALQYESPAAAVTPVPCATLADVVAHGEPPHPPGYPLAVLAASKVVRAATPWDLPDQMLKSTQVASAAAAVLLVFPSYWLGCLLFSRFTGFAGAAMLQVLPVVARVTSDGLTESWYLLFYATAAAYGTAAVLTPSAGRFFLAGLAAGAAYLVRPEGMMAGLAVATTVVMLCLAGRATIRVTLGRLAAVLVGVAVLAGPYMGLIGGLTRKPGGQGLLDAAAPRPVVGGPLFAASFDPAVDGAKALWVPRAVFQEAFKTFHYGAFVYALVGVGLALGRVRSAPHLWVTLVLGAGNLALLVALAGGKAGYVSGRHTLPVVLLGTYYAAFAMVELPRLLGRLPAVGRILGSDIWRWVSLAAVVASCLPATGKMLHEGRAGHREIGAYLRQHATPAHVVIDPYNWAQYYSGRSVRGVPPDPPGATVRWAVLEEGEAPHATLTQKDERLKAALGVRGDTANPPGVALSWPDPAEDKKLRRITLYRQDVK